MGMDITYGFWAGLAGILFGIVLIIIRSKSFMDAILDLQFRIPKDPVAIFGTILVFASAAFLVLLKLMGSR